MNTVAGLADSVTSDGDHSNLLSQRHIQTSTRQALPPPQQTYISVKSKETDISEFELDARDRNFGK